MDATFIYILLGAISFLLGIYFGIKFFVNKNGIVLTPEQEALLEEVREYAKKLIATTREQFGQSEEIQIDTIVELIHIKFPSLSESLIKWAVELLMDEIEKL